MSNRYTPATLGSGKNLLAPLTMASCVIRNERGNTMADFLIPTAVTAAKVNKFVTLIIDDISQSTLDYLDLFNEWGVQPAMALRTDYIPTKLTWGEVRRLQDLGYEIAYHGTIHGGGFTDDIINTDIDKFLADAEKNGIAVHGYVGPNGYNLPSESRHKFVWARNSGLAAYGDGVRCTDTYSSVTTVWLDEITDELKSEVIQYANTLGDGEYINFSIHSPNINTNQEALTEIFAAYKAAGFAFLTPRQAVAHSLAACGGMAPSASILNIQAGIEANSYAIISGTGKLRTNQHEGAATSKYAGKTALFLGDSITTTGTSTGNSYPIQVCNALGMTLINKASSGGDAVRMRNILQGLDTNTAPDLSNVDYVFMMIGHNCDGVYGITAEGASIENIPSDGTGYADYPNGFYPDVASCIEYIRAQNPDIVIYLITPMQAGTGRGIGTTPKARTALMEIGVMYSVPVIDVFAEVGICTRNIDVWTYDSTHPNDAGLLKLADYITAYLRSH